MEFKNIVMNHIVITPVYNEEEFLSDYITSMIRQEQRPNLLVLVDDNSSDNSSKIIKEYAEEYDWIKYIYHPSEQKKVQGSKVIEAFNFGLEKSEIDLMNFDIISKIDADLELPLNYFKEIINSFEQNSTIGLAGGYIREKKNGKWIDILSTDYHVRGALKSYRTTCFLDIGGLMPILGWDGLDEMKAMFCGWKTKNIKVGAKHFRPADNDYNPVNMALKRGIHNYKNGGNLFLAIIRSIVRITKKPYFLVGLSYFYGYMKAFILRYPKNVSRELESFINNFHLKRIRSWINSKL